MSSITPQSPVLPDPLAGGTPMICVSVGRGRHRMMIAELQHLGEMGVGLVELRLDFIRRPVNLKRLLDERKCPVIATCRRPADGGKWMRSEQDRLTLLRTAIADRADYVDLEHDIAGLIPRYGPTKRIVSYHNFEETPDNLDDLWLRMSRLDPDVIKIATFANNPMDNIRILRLVRRARIPTVGFCMGEMGIVSRVLCGKFGSPWTYVSFHEERQIAPGQISLQAMRDNYQYESIGPQTGVLGVIADPVAHSFSPQVHNACIRKAGLDLIYLPFRVPSEQLDPFMQACPEMDIRGLSVTLPHKERILKNLNVLDDNVVGVRACNTVVFRNQNAYGYNTDLEAAMAVLLEALEVEDGRDALKGRRFLILGAGGVARTIAWGLLRREANVFISARDFRNADALATQLKCKAVDWAARQNFPCEVLINATSCGMFPNMDETPFEDGWFTANVLVFDTIYNPEQTLFVKYARKAGCRTLTGVDMFARQAARQFELFTGQPADLETVRYEIKRATSAARY